MSTPVPPHYVSFRITLVVVLLAALGGTAWWMGPAILIFLGVG
ncbi:MAG: hypothetical protein ACRDRH_19410 [Pseudonocardia sp.]